MHVNVYSEFNTFHYTDLPKYAGFKRNLETDPLVHQIEKACLRFPRFLKKRQIVFKRLCVG